MVKKSSKDMKCNIGTKENCFGYILGVIGAAIYYISLSTTFWGGVVGVLKAMIWPLFLVLKVFTYIGAQGDNLFVEKYIEEKLEG